MIQSFTQIIEKSIRETFEKVMLDEIEQIKAQAQKKLDEFTEEQKKQAKKMANQMTLQMMHKMDSAGITVELKI